jgi:hypothetical protein
VFHRINKLCRPRACEDGQEQYRREKMALILGGKYGRIPCPEVGEQK